MVLRSALSLSLLALASCAPRPPPTAAKTARAARHFVVLDRRDEWSFATPDLPAVTPDGTHVVIGDRGDDRYAHVASMSLVWMHVDTSVVARTETILAPDEYREAFDLPATIAIEKQKMLAVTVERRIVNARKELASSALTTIARCELADDASAFCKKRVTCAGVEGSFDDGAFRFGSSTVQRPSWKTRPMDLNAVE